MGKDTATVVFVMHRRQKTIDLEIPLYISANDLVIALNTAFQLEIDTKDMKNCHLKAENPIALLRGNKTLSEFGIRTGSIINFTE